MKGSFTPLLVLLVAASLMVAGCSRAAPAESKAPTSAPKAVEPTKAPAKPTEAPAKKAVYPVKDRAIRLIVPYPAGGGNDIGARVLAPMLEKELGTSVEIVNRGGAGSQVGVTEVATAKPDGYTIGYANWPTVITIYLDPERKAAFDRKSFEPVAVHLWDATAAAVQSSSPWRSLKDVVDFAKANPDKLKFSDTGLMNPAHLTIIQLKDATGIKAANVHFDGGAPAITSLLGGHTDVSFGGLSPLLPYRKQGQLRIVAVMDKERNKFVADVPTAIEQGFNLRFGQFRAFFAPGGTPREIVNTLSGAIKRAMDSGEHAKKMEEMGLTPRYADAAGFAALWDEQETDVKPLMSKALAER